MDQPTSCPDEVFDIVSRCWEMVSEVKILSKHIIFCSVLKMLAISCYSLLH